MQIVNIKNQQLTWQQKNRIMCSLRTPRSVGRHIGRGSTDMSVDVSVDMSTYISATVSTDMSDAMLTNTSRLIYRPSIGRHVDQ